MINTEHRRAPTAILVSANFGYRPNGNQFLTEFRELVTSAGIKIGALLEVYRRRPDPRYLIGSGKVSEISKISEQQKIDLTIINQDLSPSQIRNLEKRTRTRVISYTGLILDIFAQRACSHEGKLQVELAQLEYLATHLVRGWTHLERQKGGIGLRGPGEKQLETDRRLLRRRMANIKSELERIKRQRAQRRRIRKKNALPMIALVGYTNTGKSTLFNVLTAAGVDSANRLFETLDPVTRRLRLASRTVLISDTVGFIKDLPHELIEAFNATLVEVREADLILCVEDAADPQRLEKYHYVQKILQEVGAANIRQIRVLNKIDLCDDAEISAQFSEGCASTVRLCALEGRGINLLCNVLEREITPLQAQTCN